MVDRIAASILNFNKGIKEVVVGRGDSDDGSARNSLFEGMFITEKNAFSILDDSVFLRTSPFQDFSVSLKPLYELKSSAAFHGALEGALEELVKVIGVDEDIHYPENLEELTILEEKVQEFLDVNFDTQDVKSKAVLLLKYFLGLRVDCTASMNLSLAG